MALVNIAERRSRAARIRRRRVRNARYDSSAESNQSLPWNRPRSRLADGISIWRKESFDGSFASTGISPELGAISVVVCLEIRYIFSSGLVFRSIGRAFSSG